MPKGVRGRSSNNEKIQKNFNWEPSIKLKNGLEKTFEWIYQNILKNEENNIFTKAY